MESASGRRSSGRIVLFDSALLGGHNEKLHAISSVSVKPSGLFGTGASLFAMNGHVSLNIRSIDSPAAGVEVSVAISVEPANSLPGNSCQISMAIHR